MKRGKSSEGAEPVDEPAVDPDGGTRTDAVTDSWIAPDMPAADPAPEPEPVVEGEAVELPGGVPPAPEPAARPVPLTIQRPVPPSMPRDAGSPEAGSAGASAAPAFDGHASDPLMDPIKVLAAERPEFVVGAAFAGGLLAAMILRRLGN